MRKRNSFIVAVALLSAATVARAQCVQTLKPISQPGFFPSLMAGPIATTGSILGMAKIDTSSGRPAIFFATFDAVLNQVSTDGQIASSSVSGSPSVFWTGAEFGVFYLRDDYSLVLQSVDGSGNAIGAARLMPHVWSPNDEFDVVWSPALNAYAIVHVATVFPEVGIWLTTITPSGSVVSDVLISRLTSGTGNPRAVALPDGRVGVLWSRSGTPPTTSLTIVDLTAGTLPTVPVTTREVVAPRIATNGRSILIIYSSTLTAGGSELRYALLDLSGGSLTPDASFLKGRGTDIAPQSLMWNATLSEWALVYLDAEIGFRVFPGESRLRRFATPTTVTSDTLLSPDPLKSRLAAPYPIVFMKGGYVGSIQRLISRTEGSESYLVKLCPFFVAATANPPVARPFVPVTLSATPSGGSPGFTYAWDFGDNDTAQGAVVQHLYRVAGTYTVTLTGRDASGAVSTARTTVTITSGKQRAVRH
jgi:hypothetical protein